jgi:hypothetical protein
MPARVGWSGRSRAMAAVKGFDVEAVVVGSVEHDAVDGSSGDLPLRDLFGDFAPLIQRWAGGAGRRSAAFGALNPPRRVGKTSASPSPL